MAAGLLRHLEPAAQHLGGELGGQHVTGPAEEVHRDDRGAAHGVDVGQRVGRGDPAERVRVVHDGGEEVRRQDQALAPGEADHGGVVAVVQTDHEFGVGAAGPVAVSPATTASSSPGGILQAQPPPCANWVSRTAEARSEVTVTNLGRSPDPRGVRPSRHPAEASCYGTEHEEMGMSDTEQASAGRTAAIGDHPAGSGSAGVRTPVAAGLAVVVLALGLLAWAKYVPYSAKVPHVLDTHTLGGSILTGDGAAVPEASLAAGWDFTVAYLDSIWKALLAGLLLAAAVQVILPATWLTCALGRSGGTAGGVRGALWSVLTLMCSCCAAPVAVGLRRLQANLPATVAFWLGNPALNPVVLVFCLAVLPWPWAVLRLAAGVAVVAAGIAAARWEERRPVMPVVAPVAAVADTRPEPTGNLGVRFARALGGLSVRLVPELVAVVFVLGAFRGVLFPIGADVPGRRSSCSRWSSPGCCCRCRPAPRWPSWRRAWRPACRWRRPPSCWSRCPCSACRRC